LADTSRFCIFQQVYKVALFHTETTESALRTSGKRAATFRFMEIKTRRSHRQSAGQFCGKWPGKICDTFGFQQEFRPLRRAREAKNHRALL